MRRKGEISQAEINRRWPHHVAIAQLGDARRQHDRNIEIGRWVDEAGEEASTRGYSILHQDVWWEVWCFASAETSEKFIAQFGGRRFDPKAKPRGPGWQGRGNFSQPTAD